MRQETVAPRDFDQADDRLGSGSTKLAPGISGPLYTLIATIEQAFPHFAFVPRAALHQVAFLRTSFLRVASNGAIGDGRGAALRPRAAGALPTTGFATGMSILAKRV
jgi:hypothetical protein